MTGSRDLDDVIAEAFGRKPSRPAGAADAAVAAAFGRETSVEAFDAAFGAERGSVSESELDRRAGMAFGRTSHDDESLMRELQEAGASGSGARGVLTWLEGGAGVEEACRNGIETFSAVQSGKVPPLVAERAAAIVRRYRPQAARETAGTSRPTGARVSARESAGPAGVQESRAVAEAREAVIEAAMERDRRFVHGADEAARRRLAESAARGAVESLTEWAMREAWTEDELVARIRERAAAIRAEASAPARTPKRSLPKPQAAQRPTSIDERWRR
ncbi:hypothetical protein N864_05835 [Intrasporangium chromatireducens Q5-1]|uniref:Uncharacterized protein n=1 Tax=Intrasporangium chromatireducens Q5-1 TaxID=584657 RepID=W9GFI1_9MICO|nr:hypothetical protein [Intrasporangium chromatireducens]EWT04830.1 hypothetical protein N864_05835 [Intrasporangium chromatireducens Q5-1]